MKGNDLIAYCLKKPGAFLDSPFGPEVAVVKVKSEHGPARIFAQFFRLKGKEKATFNCDMMMGALYRSAYPGAVTRGYHCPAVQQPYFNTVDLHDESVEAELLPMIDHAYCVVAAKCQSTPNRSWSSVQMSKIRTSLSPSPPRRTRRRCSSRACPPMTCREFMREAFSWT